MDFRTEWLFIVEAFNRFIEIVESGLKRDADTSTWTGNKMQTYSKIYNLCTDVKAINIPWEEAPKRNRVKVLGKLFYTIDYEHLSKIIFLLKLHPPLKPKNGEETQPMKYFFGFLLCLSLSAQAPPARPKVFGVAHYSIFVSDLAKARAFYEDFLGYEEAFTLPKADGTVQVAFVKINDRQYVELFNEPNKGEGQLNNLGLYTDDVERMRQYLASRGVKVPDQATRTGSATRRFRSVDPDGHTVEIVRIPARKLDRQRHWQAHAGHAHFRPHDARGNPGGQPGRGRRVLRRDPGMPRDVARQQPHRTTLDWVNMRVPDGDNHVEFMLYKDFPPPDRRGGPHHICLVVPDIQKAVANWKRGRRERATRAR